jgi:hypothetical protein
VEGTSPSPSPEWAPHPAPYPCTRTKLSCNFSRVSTETSSRDSTYASAAGSPADTELRIGVTGQTPRSVYSRPNPAGICHPPRSSQPLAQNRAAR